MVPNSGFASTLDHGRGVSRSPSTTMTYSRPSGVKPPKLFSRTSGGSGTGLTSNFGPPRAAGTAGGIGFDLSGSLSLPRTNT